MFGNLGGVNASETSPVVAVDPLDPSKLVSVWVDNDPTLLRLTDNIIRGGPGGGVFGQCRPELAPRCSASRPTG